MQTISGNQASPEVPINENFSLLSFLEVYGRNPAAQSGLSWGYFGGRYNSILITASSLTLTASNTNYIVVLKSTGVMSTSTTDTNWLDTTNYSRVYKVVTLTTTVSSYEDHRAGPLGLF